MEKKSEPTSRKEKIRKSALLLLSLNKEDAAKVLSKLDDSMIEEIVLEMAQIKSISKKEKEEVLLEFKNSVLPDEGEIKGGIDAAREILRQSLGKEKAENILGKLSRKDIEDDFSFLSEAEPGVLASLLQHESPQTIAVTLAFMTPKKAADILKFFPGELQAGVAYRLANTTKTHPDAIKEIARVLKKKYEQRDRSEYSEAGGAEALANILNHMDKSQEESILKELEANSPELAKQVKEKLYTFEDVLGLDQKEMRILINRIGDDNCLSMALRGAGDELRNHFLSAMSRNRATEILDMMEIRGKLTLREIGDARNIIVNLVRELEEEGTIFVKKDGEEYI
ncbi:MULTISPECIES: flagellar motor switch protein FliG [Leptospira]|uniref:flagellar motor switch protein FliG n=1 Tax=Leptospira TaxID=171 RepID=UPI0002BE6F79|nr:MULTISPECIES: flagellar motor switch protein FliG [Leptospira]EMK05642.1 flagellar motor switch protein FliG [Leptospira kirschneri]KXZ26124.1 endoflagellar motor switch protein [Leptospira kirschneri]KXZ30508.1 endoflagellar motor switch protein [Leptospira sp. ZV016]